MMRGLVGKVVFGVGTRRRRELPTAVEDPSFTPVTAPSSAGPPALPRDGATEEGGGVVWASLLVVFLLVMGVYIVNHIVLMEKEDSAAAAAAEQRSQVKTESVGKRPLPQSPQPRSRPFSLLNAFEREVTVDEVQGKDVTHKPSELKKKSDRQRSYVVHVPATVEEAKRPVPLLLCFHGMSRCGRRPFI